MPITTPKLWSFLYHQAENYEDYLSEAVDAPEEARLSADEYTVLNSRTDLKGIVVDREFSEAKPGGEEIVSIADDIIKAIHDGLHVTTWHGPNAELLIAAHKNDGLIG